MDFFNSIRPPSRTPKPILAFSLNFLRKITGGDRFNNLYNHINSMTISLKIRDINLLDYGCGSMNFSSRLKKDGSISNFIGVDTYPKPPDINSLPNYENYIQIVDGKFDSNFRGFQLSLLIDVLHHIPEKEHKKVLIMLAAVSDYIMIKDHFEYGFISRNLLRLADWFGNFAYGVSVPKRYFNKERWNQLVESAGLREVRIETNLRIHSGIFGIILAPRHHFISILQNRP